MILNSKRIPHLLIIDDDQDKCRKLTAQLQSHSYQIAATHDGEMALEHIDKNPPDLILLDLMLPKISGFELCRQLKRSEENRFIPIIVTTALEDEEDRLKAIELGVDDFVTTPINHVELSARIKSLLKVKHLLDDLDTSESILFSLVEALEAKDPYTSGHSRRVSSLAVELAQHLGIHGHKLDNIRKGGLLHDIGKIGVKEAVLLKENRLTDDEMDNIKTHPARGYDICVPLKSLEPCLPIIRSHHERVDGDGYPDCLKGNEIPLDAKITAVADTFDAMTENRPYRQGMPTAKALSIFAKEINSGQWDPKVVRALLHVKQHET